MTDASGGGLETNLLRAGPGADARVQGNRPSQRGLTEKRGSPPWLPYPGHRPRRETFVVGDWAPRPPLLSPPSKEKTLETKEG